VIDVRLKGDDLDAFRIVPGESANRSLAEVSNRPSARALVHAMEA
jgi:hypothetical protein